jgi:hypothetical protein
VTLGPCAQSPSKFTHEKDNDDANKKNDKKVVVVQMFHDPTFAANKLPESPSDNNVSFWARNGPPAMSAVWSLSGVTQTSHFNGVRTVFDPQLGHGEPSGLQIDQL